MKYHFTPFFVLWFNKPVYVLYSNKQIKKQICKYKNLAMEVCEVTRSEDKLSYCCAAKLQILRTCSSQTRREQQGSVIWLHFRFFCICKIWKVTPHLTLHQSSNKIKICVYAHLLHFSICQRKVNKIDNITLHYWYFFQFLLFGVSYYSWIPLVNTFQQISHWN